MYEHEHVISCGFWKRYNELRKTLGLSKKEVCAKTGIDYQYLINSECNNRLPGTLNLLAIAKLLETTVEWLLTGEEPEITQDMISRIVARTIAAAKVEQELSDPLIREIRNNEMLRSIVEYYIAKGQRYIDAQGMVLGLSPPSDKKAGAG